MKYDEQELLLAAEIRKRVSEFRRTRTADMTDEEAVTYRAQPANDLILEALKELEAIAAVVREARPS
jgi:hypothetical protein